MRIIKKILGSLKQVLLTMIIILFAFICSCVLWVLDDETV